jgi:hypothetical protein
MQKKSFITLAKEYKVIEYNYSIIYTAVSITRVKP